MADKLLIGGIDYADCVGGFDEFIIEVGLNDSDKTVSSATSEEVEFTCEGFDYLESVFYSGNGCVNHVDVDVYIECCNRTIELQILPDSLVYCKRAKKIKAKLETRDSDLIAYTCLSEYVQIENSEIENAGLVGANFVINWAESNHNVTLYTVSSYIQYYASLCGLEFESSILIDDPVYQNTVIYCQSTNAVFPDGANNHNLTVLDQLRMLGGAYNSDYRIRNGKLLFHRKDWFFDIENTLGDLDELYDNGCFADGDEICFLFSDAQLCSFGRFEYAEDSLDEFSNDPDTLELYNDLVEYNDSSNPNPALRGECETIIEFSALFQRPDGTIEVSPNNEYCKLLIWDGETDATFSEPNNLYTASVALPSNHNAMFEQDLAGDTTLGEGANNLYNRFHYIDAPDLNNACRYEMEDVTILPPDFCSMVNTILDEKDNIGFTVNIDGTTQIAVPENIRINFKKQTLELKGLTIYAT